MLNLGLDWSSLSNQLVRNDFLVNKTVYQALQLNKFVLSLLHKITMVQLRPLFVPNVEPPNQKLMLANVSKIWASREELLETDWREAIAGVYPKALLFDDPWVEFLSQYPWLWIELPELWARMQRGDVRSFDAGIDLSNYPSYYRQNFHHQTNGYLSDRSADLYDLQVETLFGGLAEPMRRRVLRPLKDSLRIFEQTQQTQPLKVLDAPCGTGSALAMLQTALPEVNFSGLDLSPNYLKKAGDRLREKFGAAPALTQGAVENLPYGDDEFHAITSIFLFHELPAPVRQQAIAEYFRVLKPQGTLVINDSIQAGDRRELTPMVQGFPDMFHEPYYRNYLQDDLVERLAKAGFVNIRTEIHYFSKIWIAEKPPA